MSETDGRGALVGEFLLSFFSCTPDEQDDIIIQAMKILSREKGRLIDPYPVLAHLHQLMQQKKASDR